ncbi:MAG: oxidoreductase [Anaerolineae bacterium]
MPGLFDPLTVGRLSLANRVMRSATAERLADSASGAPVPALGAMYRALAEGQVGLIVTGHAYVHKSGQAHPEMASIAQDELVPAWRKVIRPAQSLGARVMMQINHSGASCDPDVTPEPLSPSGVPTNPLVTPRPMSEDEIASLIETFGQAARRARAAGFDGVQIHAAHGYLISQFLTPATNQRTDAWGGDTQSRTLFLRLVVAEIRRQVGMDYPVWIKLGVAGSEKHGLTTEEGVSIASLCAACGVDCIEISHALGAPETLNQEGEACFLPLAEAVRLALGPQYPLALVNGFRTLATMNAVLESDLVQVVSMCRPLIAEPNLPAKLYAGEIESAACVSCNRCWPEHRGEGIGCHNRIVQKELALA